MMNYKDTWTYNILNNYYTKKEVKKLSKPYFEIKVVKEKKEKPKVNIANRNDKNWGYVSDKDLVQLINTTHRQLRKREISRRGKGNWVNGENLDKIEFPCFCRWHGGLGMIITGYPVNKREYTLVDISRQLSNEIVVVNRKDTLKELIEDYGIHILKGKIIIYEEEK